jgi:two-component system, NarL family, response regulator DegU
MSKAIRVLLAGENAFIRLGIRAVLEHEESVALIGDTDDILKVHQLCQHLLPDVLLINSTLLLESNEPLTYSDIYAKVSVIVLGDRNDNHIQALFQKGVAGYMFMNENPEALVRAICTVVQGYTWFPQILIKEATQNGVKTLADDSKLELTTREQEVLKMIAQGRNNSQIASALHLGKQTVRNYTSCIYSKLSLSSRAEAIVWCRENFGAA